ncbi:hypothetical protein V6N11_010811 [Hibiscus sabdariffa]|uniref:Uncharacterized protein n=1 Tax=Hibiscus sabdariffa TaxID=183260 RepID=A0ABR2S791_9ROSI
MAAKSSGAGERGKPAATLTDEEVIILEEDMIVEKHGAIPSIQFSDRVHDQVDRNMRHKTVITGHDIEHAMHVSRNSRGSRFAALEVHDDVVLPVSKDEVVQDATRTVEAIWIRNLGPLVEYVSSPNIADLGSPKVAEMVTADGVWRWEVFSHVLPPHVLLHIVVISSPLPSFLSASIAWNCEASDSFSIRYAYKLCSGEISGDEDPVWKSVHHFTGSFRR